MLEFVYPIKDLADANYARRLDCLPELYDLSFDDELLTSTSLDVLKGFLLALQEKHITLVTPITATPFVVATNNCAIVDIDTKGSFVHVDGVIHTDKKDVAEKRKALVSMNESLWTKCDENYYVMKQYEAMIAFVKKAIRKKQNFFQRLLPL